MLKKITRYAGQPGTLLFCNCRQKRVSRIPNVAGDGIVAHTELDMKKYRHLPCVQDLLSTKVVNNV